MKPTRIQLSRKKGWTKPPNTVVVSRPSRWGNPHPIGLCPVCGVDHTREEAVAEFRAEITHPQAFEVREKIQAELRGKNLACWCPIGSPCHADVLLEIANKENP